MVVSRLEVSYRHIEMERAVHIFYTVLIVRVGESIYSDVRESRADAVRGLCQCYKWNS